ncbi:MAG TPA: hypothetical protein VJ001_08650 [Rhodocyclaceae bacterium]|nr:hypothetical protein [Rhodocyclaceae bacterium]
MELARIRFALRRCMGPILAFALALTACCALARETIRVGVARSEGDLLVRIAARRR